MEHTQRSAFALTPYSLCANAMYFIPFCLYLENKTEEEKLWRRSTCWINLWLEMTEPYLNTFSGTLRRQHKCYFTQINKSLVTNIPWIRRLRTFHCRVSVLLVRWENLGGNGTSGTLQCVVNEPASEHEPRTELYIAETLKENNQNTFSVTKQKHGLITAPGNISDHCWFLKWSMKQINMPILQIKWSKV